MIMHRSKTADVNKDWPIRTTVIIAISRAPSLSKKCPQLGTLLLAENFFAVYLKLDFCWTAHPFQADKETQPPPLCFLLCKLQNVLAWLVDVDQS